MQPTCPLEIKVELLLELMSIVAARLGRLEATEPSAQKRVEYAQARFAVLDRRFEFDPDDEAQVEALMKDFDRYATLLASELSRVAGAASAA